MSKLFKKQKVNTIEPEEPATMPDEDDVAAKRKRRQSRRPSSQQQTRRVRRETPRGREYSRGTLG